jgi:glycosyltransferase involved in cell wall biosynthesis
VFLPPVSKPSIPALLASMDVCYIGLARKPVFRFGVSPNKLIDYMMAARPVIHAIEAGNDLVAESGCGISISPEDPAALAQAVRRLMACTPAEREAMGQRGRNYVMLHHDYRVLARRFLEAMT